MTSYKYCIDRDEGPDDTTYGVDGPMSHTSITLCNRKFLYHYLCAFH